MNPIITKCSIFKIVNEDFANFNKQCKGNAFLKAHETENRNRRDGKASSLHCVRSAKLSSIQHGWHLNRWPFLEVSIIHHLDKGKWMAKGRWGIKHWGIKRAMASYQQFTLFYIYLKNKMTISYFKENTAFINIMHYV